MELTKDEQEWLEAAAKRNGDIIKESKVFFSLFTENYEKDPLCILQFGIAILLDKPIYLLVPRGTHLSGNMMRLARGFEYYEAGNDEDLKAATARLVGSIYD
jgi:hypothetical protein